MSAARAERPARVVHGGCVVKIFVAPMLSRCAACPHLPPDPRHCLEHPRTRFSGLRTHSARGRKPRAVAADLHPCVDSLRVGRRRPGLGSSISSRRTSRGRRYAPRTHRRSSRAPSCRSTHIAPLWCVAGRVGDAAVLDEGVEDHFLRRHPPQPPSGTPHTPCFTMPPPCTLILTVLVDV